jgi:hypothetical protein
LIFLIFNFSLFLLQKKGKILIFTFILQQAHKNVSMLVNAIGFRLEYWGIGEILKSAEQQWTYH